MKDSYTALVKQAQETEDEERDRLARETFLAHTKETA